MFQKISPSRETVLLTYKLLHDSLFILMFFFLSAIIAEGLLPGIISLHLALYNVAILILLNILCLSWLSKKCEIPATKAKNKKMLYLFFLIIIALTLNAMMNLNLLFIFFTLLLLSVTFYLLFEEVFSASA